MTQDTGFKHDINKIIEGCAEALEKKMGFNQIQVLRYFQLFPMDCFSNTPMVPIEEFNDWYYLRDSWSHGAVIYNYETKELRLIKNTWNEKNLAKFRLTEDEVRKKQENYDKKMALIKRTLAYRKLKSVIEWYFTCPLPFITVYGERSAVEFIENIPEQYSENFELGSVNYKEITRNLFDAFHHDGGKSNREKNYVQVGVSTFRDDGEYYNAPLFSTPEDVLEFFIKHNTKDVYPYYDDEKLQYRININEGKRSYVL
ncbi:MAG: hypothetical protein JXA99_16815 [Candidatus Lokiarchaeota archaeon]|nr:hypothetical protein [Candidatus Lokiarchaeota archaeon]